MKRPVFGVRLRTSMLDYLTRQSRASGKSIVELINEGLERDPFYLEYVAAIRKATLKNMLAETISTTVVEPAKNVSRESDPDRAIGYEESKAAWLLEEQDREAEREYQRELKREPTPEELAMDEEWEREQRKNQGTDDVK